MVWKDFIDLEGVLMDQPSSESAAELQNLLQPVLSSLAPSLEFKTQHFSSYPELMMHLTQVNEVLDLADNGMGHSGRRRFWKNKSHMVYAQDGSALEDVANALA